VAVVTGANRGIGHALAARLAEHGLTVVLTARDGERGEAAAAPLLARGLAVVFRRLDVSDPASVAEFAAWIRDALGGLDILVSHHLPPAPRAPLSETPWPNNRWAVRALGLLVASDQDTAAPPVSCHAALAFPFRVTPHFVSSIIACASQQQ
jgi:NAD(P)-dependent dehydrogenase (short-subunit alcohol dehydrogenase family)